MQCKPHHTPIIHRVSSPQSQILIPPHSPHPPLLNIIPGIRPPRLPHLLLGHVVRHLLDVDELLDAQDLAGDGLADGVVDGGHAFAEAKGFEDALGFEGEADAGAHEGYAEVGHGLFFCVSWVVRCGAFARLRFDVLRLLVCFKVGFDEWRVCRFPFARGKD